MTEQEKFGYGDAVHCEGSGFGVVTRLSEYKNPPNTIWYEIHTLRDGYNIHCVFPVEKLKLRRMVLIEKTKSFDGDGRYIHFDS